MKKQATDQEKIFSIYTHTTWFKKWTKDLNTCFAISLNIKEIKIYTKIRCHYKPTTVAKLKKIYNVKCWQGCETTGSLILAAKWNSYFGKLGVFLQNFKYIYIYIYIYIYSYHFIQHIILKSIQKERKCTSTETLICKCSQQL